MAIQNKIIENLDGSLTSISFQNNSEIKSVVEQNNKDKFEVSRSGKSQYKGDSTMGHHVARIPMIAVEQMMRDGVWNNQARMKEWLNDPINEPFRTTKGKL
jgi:hypothetical protein